MRESTNQLHLSEDNHEMFVKMPCGGTISSYSEFGLVVLSNFNISWLNNIIWSVNINVFIVLIIQFIYWTSCATCTNENSTSKRLFSVTLASASKSTHSQFTSLHCYCNHASPTPNHCWKELNWCWIVETKLVSVWSHTKQKNTLFKKNWFYF